ncbi:hypothetical protein ACFYYN_27350 [Streptomyces sp. NPDC001902]
MDVATRTSRPGGRGRSRLLLGLVDLGPEREAQAEQARHGGVAAGVRPPGRRRCLRPEQRDDPVVAVDEAGVVCVPTPSRNTWISTIGRGVRPSSWWSREVTTRPSRAGTTMLLRRQFIARLTPGSKEG